MAITVGTKNWHFSDASKFAWTMQELGESPKSKRKRNRLQKSLDRATESLDQVKDINSRSKEVCSELTELFFGDDK